MTGVSSEHHTNQVDFCCSATGSAMTKGRLHLTVLPQVWPSVRPRDCADGDEPCPWDECQYRISNLAHPEVTCAIDVADGDPEMPDDEKTLTQTYVARVLGVSQPRIVALEQKAMRKIRVHPNGLKLIAALRGL